jgi:hypothetical protein
VVLFPFSATLFKLALYADIRPGTAIILAARENIQNAAGEKSGKYGINENPPRINLNINGWKRGKLIFTDSH